MDACTVAACIIQMAADAGDRIDHLKLQKLCYYAQGYSLALRQRRLFEDPIQAGEIGPVVPSVCQTYGQRGREQILPAGPAPELDQWQRDLLELVYARFGWMTTWALRNQTHLEQPWRDAWRTGECDAELPPKQIRDFFLKELLGQRVDPKPWTKEEVREFLLNNEELARRVAERRNDPSSPSTF